MRLHLKLWSGAGMCVALGATAPSAMAASAQVGLAPGALALHRYASEGGEGGGEAGGGAPSQYRLRLDPSADPVYDGAVLASAYVDNVQRAYVEAASAARRLQVAIDALLAQPGDATLAAARNAWVQARRPYLATEGFRYYDGPIDGPETAKRAAGPESRLNAWPLNEVMIDYVEGEPRAGLVQALDVPMTRETVLARDQVSDEADVTTGWHAIEFLLWGQDLSEHGPGARPATDYAPSAPVSDRRRAYLKLLADQLLDDLDWLASQWQRENSAGYAQEFLVLEPHEAVGRMLTGAALLVGHELASERLAVGLDSGAQEDEQSCFSDSTWQDFVWGLAGIKRIYYGRGEAASIATTIQRLNPGLALEMEARFADAERRLADLHDPFDRILIAAPGSRERVNAEAAVLALQRLAAGLRESGRALGVLVIVPGV